MVLLLVVLPVKSEYLEIKGSIGSRKYCLSATMPSPAEVCGSMPSGPALVWW